MTIRFSCPSCGVKLELDDADAGKRCRCSGCQEICQAPSLPDGAPPASSQVPPSPISSPPAVSPPQSLPPVNPYSSPPAPSLAAHSNPSDPLYGVNPGAGGLRPHQGALALVLGICGLSVSLLGCFCCPLTSIAGLSMGIPAIVVARNDRKLMRQGVVDPSGDTVAMIGGILGWGAVVLSLVYLLLFVVNIVSGIINAAA